MTTATAVRELPILLSGSQVIAILEGRQTQVRKVITYPIEPNGMWNGHDFDCLNDYLPPSATLMRVIRGKVRYWTSDVEGWERECPFGSPGDRMWGRETFYCDHCEFPDGPKGQLLSAMYYRADGDPAWEEGGPTVWRPSIHMPRWASRLTLENTDVRVQRVQDISEEDAIAEGIRWQEPTEEDREWALGRFATDEDIEGVFLAPGTDNGFSPPGHREKWHVTARGAFGLMWDSNSGKKKGCSWADNPWVWAITFRRLEQPA